MADILVVEDEPDLRDLIVEEVENMGHSTAIASDGAEALRYLATHQPQLILSDINMPNMNGCAFRQEIVENFSHL
ncbi:MAG: response regulator, partial [Pseudomonadota bacterium]